MQNDPNAMRECPLCGKELRRTAHVCPHCHKSLAAYDQRKWEQESPLPEPKDLPVPLTSRSFKTILLNPISLFFLIAVIFGLTLILYPSREKEDEEHARTESVSTMQGIRTEPQYQYEMADIPAPTPAAEMPSPPEQEEIDDRLEARRRQIEEAQARQQKIISIADDILLQLKNEETITPDILYLKSGRELHCTIIEDLETQLKVNYRGVTTSIEKTDIEKMKHRSQQSVDQQLQRMSLEQATRIVDNGLVEYRGEWITPEEKEIRVQAEKLKLEKERLELEAAARAQQQQAQKPPVRRVTSPPVTVGGGIDFSKVVITEGQGFGDIIVGHPRCTKRFIKSKLGKPDVEEGRRLKYDWKYGMRFIFATDADLLIYFELNRRFQGKLSSGVSMSSTMEDVFRAYGEPVAREQVNSLDGKYANRTLYQQDLKSRMNYRDLGLQFFFEEDGITGITVMRI